MYNIKGDTMVKKVSELEKKDKINRINYIIIFIMFVCLIIQVISLYFDLNNVFRVFEYLFGLFLGVSLGFILGVRVL